MIAVMASAIWASTAAGVVAAAIQIAAGPLLGALLTDPRLPAMSALLALPLPLVGAGGAMQGMLTRDRNYRALAGRTLIGQGLGTLAGIAAALAGAGAWALVLQQMVSATAGALALLLRANWRPSAQRRSLMRALRRPNLRAVRELLALGLPLTASTLVQLGRYRLFVLVIGATAGAAPLGEVHMAFRLVDTVRELVFTALWRLMLPAMSARQQELAALRRVMDRCLGLAALVVLPLLGMMAVMIVPLTAAAARAGLGRGGSGRAAIDRPDRLAVPVVSGRRRPDRQGHARTGPGRQHRRRDRDAGRRRGGAAGNAGTGDGCLAGRAARDQPLHNHDERARAAHRQVGARSAPACPPWPPPRQRSRWRCCCRGCLANREDRSG